MNGFEGLWSAWVGAVPWDSVWIWAFKSAAILAAALVLDRLLGQATAALRHRVWAFAFSLVLLMPAAELALPGLPVLPDLRMAATGSTPVSPVLLRSEVLGESWADGGSSSSTEAWNGNDGAGTAAGVSQGQVGLGRGVAAPSTGAVTRARLAGDPMEAPGMGLEESQAATGGRVDAGPRREGPDGGSAFDRVWWPRIVGGVWFLGLVGWLSALGVGLRRAQRRYRMGWEPPARILRHGREIVRELRLKRAVPVRVGAVDVPATWGWRRPRILLPADAEQWSTDRLRRVLMHELAHVKRRDWPLNLIAEVARAVHWYNPLAWHGLGRMRVERERACDDVVLNTGARPSEYATDLLEVARGTRGGFAGTPVMALGREHRLADRIDDLLDTGRRRVEGRHSAWVSGSALALVFGSLALLTVAAGGVPPVASEGAEDQKTPPVSATSAPTTERPNEAVLGSSGSVGAQEEVLPSGSEGSVGTGEGPALDQGSSDPDASPSASLRDKVGSLVAQAGLAEPASYSDVLQQAVPVACNWDRGSGRGRSMETNVDDDGDWKIHWRTPECETEIWLEGEVVFSDAEDGIASMGRDARFEVRERQDGIRRRLVAEPDGGSVRYRFWLDGDETEFDASARRWLQTFLPQLFRQTTLHAEARVARLFDSGGTEAVLDEVRRMHSDHVAARYLELLMTQDGFEPAEVPQVLDLVADAMDSDHYVATILEAVGDRWGIRQEYEASYIRAVAGLESDHYAHGALMALVREGMSDGMAGEILAASRLIDSDHYKADLLTHMAEADGIGSTDRAAYVEAFASVESDHYQHSIVMALLDHGPPESGELVRLLALMETVESDHYRADVLTRIGRDYPLEGANVAAFLRAARGIESDHYASEVGRVLVRRADLESEQVDLVLDIAGGISGDHGRGELMRALIREHSLSAAQRDRFRELALQIDSRHLQDQLLAELVR
ncbi:MAG: M56 family metallopeptidase [Gemmatimonadetes bacterium]|nr:M56 family metallopeptidase [Gemmatimonadota bacterium]